MDMNYDVITFILRSPREAKFANIINLQPWLLKQPLKTQAKLKELEIMY